MTVNSYFKPVVGPVIAILIAFVPALANAQEEDAPPEADPVGGLTMSLLAGSQFVGSTAAQAGFTLGYYSRGAGLVGFEFEGALTLGPAGRVYHGLLNVVLQTGARTSKIVPYVVLGGGMFRAQVDLQDSVEQELQNFDVVLGDTTETGPMIDFGLGVRYFLSDGLSIRLDYREFRALRESDDSFFDRLFALRRIGAMLAVEF